MAGSPGRQCASRSVPCWAWSTRVVLGQLELSDTTPHHPGARTREPKGGPSTSAPTQPKLAAPSLAAGLLRRDGMSRQLQGPSLSPGLPGESGTCLLRPETAHLAVPVQTGGAPSRWTLPALARNQRNDQGSWPQPDGPQAVARPAEPAEGWGPRGARPASPPRPFLQTRKGLLQTKGPHQGSRSEPKDSQVSRGIK